MSVEITIPKGLIAKCVICTNDITQNNLGAIFVATGFYCTRFECLLRLIDEITEKGATLE